VASTFKQIVAAFAAATAAQNGQTLVTLPGTSGWKCVGVPGVPDIKIGYRQQELSSSDSPPSIVCVPRGGPLVAPTQVGGPHRNWRTRQFSMSVYVWGKDDGQAEDLYINSLIAFQHLYNTNPANGQPGTAPVFGSEVWESETQSQAGQATRGWMISYSCMWEINVQDAPNTLTIVREVDAALSLTTPTEVINVVVT